MVSGKEEAKKFTPFYNPYVIGAVTILFGLLYIPAFIYGYFWLWVFPFTSVTTVFLRTQLDHAIEQVSDIDDEGKKSWSMSRRLFGLTVVQVLVCAFPFIFVLWLYALGFIIVQHASIIDQSLYSFVLSFIRDNYLPVSINFSDGTVQIVLSCSYFMFSSLLFFSLFCFRKAVVARKSIFNAKEEEADRKYNMPHNLMNALELLFSGFLFFVFLFSVEEVLIRNYSQDFISLFLVSIVLFSVFTVTYTLSRFFLGGLKIIR